MHEIITIFATAMKEEIGKWLMDIAKYILTAILLTSLFDGLEDSWITYVMAFITTAITFMTGIVLLRKEQKKEKQWEQ